MTSSVHAEFRPATELPPVAEWKLAAPPLRRGILRRARIVEAIEGGVDVPLTLVAAPAGYGKTTAVRTWAEISEAACAWVTLDALDNDPARMWTYIAEAVDRVCHGLGWGSPTRRRRDSSALEDSLDELINGIASLESRLAIVLDDAQYIEDQECLASIGYLIDRLPATARVIMITRVEPALELARLRPRGALLELRTTELALDPAEARELLRERADLNLDDEQIELLRKRTEGWPAALYVAALWLRSVDDPGQASLEFSGEHRYVAEYLSHEVLGALDPDHRSFLLRVAVLGCFTADLCDAVLAHSDSAELLAELEASNMFVHKLEHGEWFRVHTLFAEFAAKQLESEDPGAVTQLHRRASTWLNSRGRYVEATTHASLAGDHEVVAQILSTYHLALLRNGRAGTLFRLAGKLPDETLAEHPTVATATAAAATLLGHRTLERRRLIQLASRGIVRGSRRSGSYQPALLAMVRAAAIDNGVSQAVRDGREAVELSGGSAADVLVDALAALARALYFAGDLDSALEVALRGVEQPSSARRTPGYALARVTLALVAAEQGRLDFARRHAEHARAIVGSITSSRSWLGGNSAVASGAVLACEGDLRRAEHEFATAETLLRDDEVASIHHAHVLMPLAEVRARRGRIDEAKVTLHQAREEMAELSDCGRLPTMAAEVDKRLVLARQRASDGVMTEPPSQAESAVLQLLATDLSVPAIAGELFLSANTVRSHTRSIYRKLGVGSREAAVARANTLGLLQ